MKKTILLIFALFGAMIGAYSQSLENLGDEAFVKGLYGDAVSYYEQADKLDSSSELKEKIKKSKTLKTEFEIIDRAISNQDYDKANTHIDAVLRIDPNNYWAQDRRKSFASQASKAKRKRLKLMKGFDGENFVMENNNGVALGVGLNSNYLDPVLCLSASYYNYRKFPFMVDVRAFGLDFNNFRNFDVFISVGPGSTYIVNKHFMLDFGLGAIVSKDLSYTNHLERSRYFGGYVKAGTTLRFAHNHLGVSYEYMRAFSKYDLKIQAHLLTLRVFLGPMQ